VSRPTYIFAGGGTGGHLYPALAVAEKLLVAKPEAAIIFACSDRPIDRRVLGSTNYAIVPQPIQPLPRRLRLVPGFLVSWWKSGRLAGKLLDDLKPSAVLGTGGFAAAPVVKQAARAQIPAGMLNPDAVPGKANLYLARYVDAVFTQFDSTGERFDSRFADRIRTVGCPIRDAFSNAERAEAMERFSLDPNRKTLLVNGGSQGAATINEAIALLDDDLGKFADRWQLLHVTGLSQVTEVADTDNAPAMRSVILDYCDRMDLAYAAADLAVCRGGASTAAELAASGTPSVIMPYPYHRDDHQRLNADPLAECGAGVVCVDAADGAKNASMLRENLLPLLDDSASLEAMRTSAVAMGRPDAAGDVAAWMLGEG